MDRMPPRISRLGQFIGLDYVEAERVLRTLKPRDIAYRNFDLQAGPEVKALRSNIMRPGRRERLAAIFGYGMGQTHFGAPVSVASSRHEGYEFVLAWPDGDGELYTPLHIIEVTPTSAKPRVAITRVLDQLEAYGDEASDLTVAVYMNRRGRFEYGPWLQRHALRMTGVWLFGRLDAAATEWFIYGNLKRWSHLRTFQYPEWRPA